MEQEQLLIRKERGKHIAQTSRIQQTKKGWKVPSQSGNGFYMVVSNGEQTKCSCPDHEIRSCKCKHIWAVELTVTEEIDNNGNITVTKTVRKTYSQDWKAYNKAQQNEKPLFMQLLADLTRQLPNPEYKFGRPTTPLSDMIYSMVFKTYSTKSGRRFTGDMQTAQEKGYVEKTTKYNTMFDYFQKKELTSLLCDFVTITSLPLQSVENDFAVDSTGFGTSNFQRWFSYKHGKEIRSRRWVKAHLMTGTKTNIVTSCKITSEFDNDSPELKALVDKTGEHFDMQEISADKAYLSKKNLEHIDRKGATPYIPFKKNNKARGNGSVWKKMFYYFQLHNEEYLEHYHKRSNVETTIYMIKSKFGDMVKSKKWTSQVNEVLCKIICHNICVIIQETHELGINPQFCPTSPPRARIVS